MTYEEVWNEQKEWLKSSVDHLEERKRATTGKEQARITAKLEGMKIAYQRMLQTEKMYELSAEDKDDIAIGPFKAGMKVKALTGFWKDCEGEIIAISTEKEYPITVEFEENETNQYYEEQLEIV